MRTTEAIPAGALRRVGSAAAVGLALAASLCVPARAQPAAPEAGAGAASTPESSSPDESPEAEARVHAKALFELGVAAYESNHFEDALASFQEAYRLAPHPLVQINIANCYDKLGKPLEALFHFEQFMKSDVGTPEQRHEVTAAMERLQRQVGQVQLRVTPDGALVTIDGGEQRRAPIVDPISLPAGEHKAEVTLEGYQTLERAFTVKGDTSSELNLVLERRPETAAAPVPVGAGVEPGAQAAASGGETPGTDQGGTALVVPTEAWIVGGVSAALLLAGSVTGILALDAQSDFDSALRAKLDPNATSIARVESYRQALDAADRADALALTTDLLLGSALIGSAVTAYLVLSKRGQQEDVAYAPAVTPHAFGARVSGRF